jgi:FSR family fosmidomycin resistance protein-like MFS transporter
MLADIDRKAMSALSTGHLATDLAQGSLPALLPYLKTEFDLSYTKVAALVLAATISSSIVQPFFGFWSDARGAVWLMPAGITVAGVGIALASVAPSYVLVLLAVLVSGLGVAAFHPEGSKFASLVSGARRATGMAFFSIGGNIGFALGPLVASGLFIAFGLNGGLLLVLPGVLVAAVLVSLAPYLTQFVPPLERAAPRSARPRQSWGMSLLLTVVALRSIAHMGLFTFIPLWEDDLGHSKARGTLLLALFLFAGAVGTILGGPLADRFGLKPVLISSLAAAVPLILTYVLVGGILGVVALALSGGTVIGTFGVTLVMGQQYMPGRVAMASGLSIGLAIGLGGVAATALGVLADAVDLRTALIATAVGPALCLVLAFFLPPVKRTHLIEPAASPI